MLFCGVLAGKNIVKYNSTMESKSYKSNLKISNFITVVVLLVLLVSVTLSDARRSKSRRRYHRGSSVSRYICEESEEDLDRLKAMGKVKCNCPSIYAPVCGSDGVTYHNRCFIHCTAQERYQGFHKGKRLTVLKMEPCNGDH